MQDRHQRFAQCPMRRPAQLSYELKCACQDRQYAGQWCDDGNPCGGNPRQERHERQHHGGKIEAAERRGKWAGIVLPQPIAGKRGDDATGDHCDQQDDKSDSEAICQLDVSEPIEFTIEGHLGCEQSGNYRRHLVVATVACCDEFAQHEEPEHRQEGTGDDDGGDISELFRTEDDRAAGKPEAEKQNKGQAGQRLPAGPVGYGRQQEAGDDRRHVAEQQFMLMPDDGRQDRRHMREAEEPGNPERDHRRSVQRADEEKGAEAAREDKGECGGRRRSGMNSHVNNFPYRAFPPTIAAADRFRARAIATRPRGWMQCRGRRTA